MYRIDINRNSPHEHVFKIIFGHISKGLHKHQGKYCIFYNSTNKREFAFRCYIYNKLYGIVFTQLFCNFKRNIVVRCSFYYLKNDEIKLKERKKHTISIIYFGKSEAGTSSYNTRKLDGLILCTPMWNPSGGWGLTVYLRS